METDTLMLRNIKPRLKGKIARRVKAAGTNMNDVLVGILADAYGVAFTPSGVRRINVGPSSQALLTVPAELKDLIRDDAREHGDNSYTNVALQIICKEFDEPFVATGRWPRKDPAAA